MEIIKIEIILSNTFRQPLIELLEEAGVHGYTAVEIFRGKGIKRGEHLSEGLLPTSRNTLLFTIASSKNATRIVESIQPFLDERGGVLVTYQLDYASGLS